jgi:hypothetical protein
MSIQVYAKQKGYNFKQIKIVLDDGAGVHTINLLDDDAQHLFEVLNGRCGVMELYDEDDQDYSSPKEVIYASKILKKEGLEYIIEPN